MYLVSAKEMQGMDHQTIHSLKIPGRVLMENAGRGAVDFLLRHFNAILQPTPRIGIFAGRGNNGGDGFVMARYLCQLGMRVSVYLLTEKNKVQGDAAANLALLDHFDLDLFAITDLAAFTRMKSQMRHQHLWIDAILGTGLNADVRGLYKDVIAFMNASPIPVFAVDIPSGLNADTGQVCGTCVTAAATATFAYAKIGHMMHPGADLTGRLGIVDIGIPPFMAEKTTPRQALLTPSEIHQTLCPRSPSAHKGTCGHLLVLAGSPGKTGAAALTTLSALKTGAGLVSLGIPASLNPVLEPMVLEAMTCPLPDPGKRSHLTMDALDSIFDLLNGKKCLALGPGISTEPQTRKLVLELVSRVKLPLVIDADGLNGLAGATDLLKSHDAPVILTPHPGEMARLLGISVPEVQADRVAVAREWARAHGVHLVLKGARTVIAHPDGRMRLNPTGNSGMASGGMGDVLTGMIAGLVTQGYSPFDACCLGVYLHGLAADLAAQNIGATGYLASDVMARIPAALTAISHIESQSYAKSFPCVSLYD